jgi:tape measure domain-containing protein
MAITLGLLEIVMRTDLDQFTGGMRTASQVVDQTSARMTRAVSGATDSVTNLERTLGGFRGGNAFQALTISALRAEDSLSRLRNVALLLPAAIGGVGAAAGSKALMDYADQATTVRNRLAVLTEQQSQRVAMEREVFEIAQRTRSSYVATSQLFSRTTQAAQQLGRSQGEVGRFVETVSMTSQISGSSTQEANAAAVQLAQGLSSNRLQGDELRSILENNVALAQLLARELAGGSVGRLREMGTEGLLTAQQVMDAVLRGSTEVRRQFEQTQATFANSFVIVNNALVRYVGQLDQAVGASQAFFNLMQSLADNLPQIAGGIALITAALVALGAVKIGGALIGAVASARNAGNEGLARALEQARGRLVALEAEREKAVSVARAAENSAIRSGSASPAELAPREIASNLAREEASARVVERERLANVKALIAAENDRDQRRMAVGAALQAAEAKGEKAAEMATAARQRAAAEMLAREEAGARSVERAQSANVRALIAAENEKDQRRMAVASAYEAAEARGQRAADLANAARQRGANVATEALGRQVAAVDKAQSALDRLRDARGRADAVVLDEAKRLTLGLSSQEKITAAQQRLDRIDQQIAERRVQLGEARAVLGGRQDEAARAISIAQQRVSIDQAQVENARALVAARSALADAERRIESVRSRSGIIESASVLQSQQVNLARAAVEQAKQRVSVDQAQVESAKALASARNALAEADRRVASTAARGGTIESAVALQGQQVANARTAVENAAAVERARLATVAAEANRNLAATTESVARAQNQVATSSEAANRGVGVMAGTLNVARGVFGSLYSFLGGPWGVALTGLSVALAAIGLNHANAALRAREQEEALARIPRAIDEITAAQQRQQAITPQQAIAGRADAAAGEQAISGVVDQLRSFTSSSLFGGNFNRDLGAAFARSGRDIFEFDDRLRDARGNVTRTQEVIVDLRKALESIGATRADLSQPIAEMLRLISRVEGATQGVRRLQDALNGGVGGVDIEGVISGRRDRQITDSINNSADGFQNQFSDRPSMDTQIQNTAAAIRQQRLIREETARNNARERGGRAGLLAINRRDAREEFAVGLQNGSISNADIERLVQSRTPQERRQRGSGTEERWTPQERVTRELSDALAVASNRMGRLDEETLRYARSARLADEEQRKFIEAVTSGNLDAAPEKFKRIREQVEAIARARLSTDLTNERNDMFLDPTEQKVAQRLRAAGLTEANASAEASQIRLNEQLSQTKGLFNDAFSGIGQQILQGASAADILAGSLQRVAGSLLRVAEQWVATQAFNGIMGLFGGGGGGPTFPGLFAGFGLHDGGLAGSSFWGPRSGYRGPFVQAHSGMGPNEIPAILERGEAVLSRQMTNALPGTMSGLTQLAEHGGGGGGEVVISLAPGVIGSIVGEAERRSNIKIRQLEGQVPEMARGAVAEGIYNNHPGLRR